MPLEIAGRWPAAFRGCAPGVLRWLSVGARKPSPHLVKRIASSRPPSAAAAAAGRQLRRPQKEMVPAKGWGHQAGTIDQLGCAQGSCENREHLTCVADDP